MPNNVLLSDLLLLEHWVAAQRGSLMKETRAPNGVPNGNTGVATEPWPI